MVIPFTTVLVQKNDGALCLLVCHTCTSYALRARLSKPVEKTWARVQTTTEEPNGGAREGAYGRNRASCVRRVGLCTPLPFGPCARVARHSWPVFSRASLSKPNKNDLWFSLTGADDGTLACHSLQLL